MLHEVRVGFDARGAEEKSFRLSGIRGAGALGGSRGIGRRWRRLGLLGLGRFGLNLALDGIISDGGFNDLVAFHVVFELAVRNGAEGELREGALPGPQQQQHDGQIPQWRIPLGRFGFELPFGCWLARLHS